MTIDTRTLTEIWKTLTPDQQTECQSEIVSKVGITTMALYWWRTGRYSPNNPLVRKTVAGIVRKYTNTNVKPEYLFPRK